MSATTPGQSEPTVLSALRFQDVVRFWRYVKRTDSCWLWQGPTMRRGYGQFTIRQRTIQAHRLAYAMFYGPVPPGALVCHHCDVPACVRPDHLWLGTHDENMQDMVQKGRQNNGWRLKPSRWEKVPPGPRPGSVFQRRSDGRWVGTINLQSSMDGKRQRQYVYGDTRAEVEAQLATYTA